MSIQQIVIQHLRNLTQVELELSPCFNVFFGENGSGKTSFIEALYLLGHGRSFRSHLTKRIIQHNEPALTVFAKVFDESSQGVIPLGIEKTNKGEVNIRRGGETITSAAALAALLPLQLINPDSYRILEAGPKFRRQFLDWGLFHVEHSFFPLWQRLQRLLKQRNAALKQSGDYGTVAPWDNELIKGSEAIDHMRDSYVIEFNAIFQNVIGKMLEVDGLKLSYWRGWDRESTLAEVLKRHFYRDQQLGYSQYGPHRADLKITVNGVPAHDVLSRGQQKLVVSAMSLAQGLLLKQQTNKNCIYLIDDLPAELDISRRRFLANTLVDCQAQVFVTGVAHTDFHNLFPEESTGLFHVEHGTIAAVENEVCEA